MSRFNSQLVWRVGWLVILAGVSAPRANADSLPLWGRWEGTFTSTEVVDAAQDLQLKVELISPDGDTRHIEGFWDGGREWKSRFMPDQPGTWRYRTRTEPQVAGLNGQQGSFEVREERSEETNRFLKHGAVEVSENGRYLEHADGTSFFFVGDTAWNGALKSTTEDWGKYLHDRSAKGFTAIQFVTTQWRAAHQDQQGQTAYEGYDEITIHPEFFQRLDERVDAINEAGLLAAPVMLWALGEEHEVPGKLPEDQAIRLARYIKARYGAHHVIWFLAGDENFSGDRGDRWKRIGRAVFDGSPHDALVTLHPQGRQWHFEQYKDEDWFDLIIYQSSHGGGPRTLGWIHSGPPAEKWREEPARPIINSEPGYEDHVAREREERHTAFDVRQQAYYSLLVSPPAGISYGAHGIWSWETEPAEPLNHRGTGMAKPWHEALHLPGSEDIKHLAELFTSIQWWTLRPAPELLAKQPGGDDPTQFVPAASSESGDLALIYMPQGGVVEIQRDELASEVAAEWFNPRDGSRQQTRPNDSSTFTTPDEEDWVLVLTK